MKLKSCTETTINRRKLEIEIDAETFQKEYDKAFRNVINKANIPGFRKGKAPRGVVEKMYGKEYFYEEALKALYPDAVQSAIDESGIDFLDDEINVEIVSIGEGKDLVFTAEVTVRPEVKLPQYKGIKATRPSDTATDEDVDRELQHVRERYARIKDIDDRPAKDGDIVNIDFKGMIDGEPFEGGAAEKFDLTLGSGQFIPGFEDQVAGHSIGDEFDVNVTFPEEYGAEELAGKDAVFECKLNGIKEKEYDDIDDEFAKDHSDCDTLDEYKAQIRSEISQRKKNAADSSVESQIFRFIQDEMECVVPNVMIEKRIDMELREISARLSERGMTLKDYMNYSGLSMEEVRDQVRENCENQVKIRLAMEEIAKKENITADDEDIDKRVKDMAERHQLPEEKIRELIDIDLLRSDVVVEKAVEFVRENAEITEGE